LQGTAINKADLMCDLREKEKDLKTISIKFKTFQAIIDDSKHEVLWNEFRPYEMLMDEKVLMGTRAFNRERQNVRGSNEESIIKESFIRYYDEIPVGKRIVSKVVTCDPSIGQKLLNDYSGFAAIYHAEIPDAPGILDYYIEDLINEHLSQNLRILTLENFAERHSATEVLIEGIAGFKDFALEAKRRTDLPIKIIDHVKDKISNLAAESPKFENGRVWIKKSIPIKLRNMLVEQLIDNYPKHDDLRDAVLLGIKGKTNTVSVF